MGRPDSTGSPRAGRRFARAAGASRAEDQSDSEPIRRMVGPLAALRERSDGRDPPADQREVERRDRDSAHDAPRRLATMRQGDGHDRRPTERDRKMNRRGDRKQHHCAPLMRQHHGAGGAGPLQHVLASHQRPHRRGDCRTRRPSQAGSQGVAGKSVVKNAAHASIVARGRLLPRKRSPPQPRLRASSRVAASGPRARGTDARIKQQRPRRREPLSPFA
jgi:hypothetical protein